ncbi:hypothetical protein UR09_03135 [Candidatus Nitromaritima sp. SCGC AAA799-A02]|nr:hypothetical protein UR09_03135 [Candidatus Nitromaritima sp. SCGC AAA799-A02]
MPGAAAATTAGSVAFGLTVNAAVGLGIAGTSAISLGIAVGTVVSTASIASAALSIIGTLQSSEKPRVPEISSIARDRSITIRQAISAHRVIYGEVRVAGVVTYMESTNSGNNLHQVISVAGHEINKFVEWMVNDEKVTLDSDGVVLNGNYFKSNPVKPKGYEEAVKIKAGLGTTAGDSSMLTELQANTNDWTANHKQSGCAKFYVNFDHGGGVFISNLPNISAVVQGRKIYDPRTSSTVYSNNAALCIRDYLVDTGYGMGEPVARINDTSFIAAANICEEMVSVEVSRTFTADSVLDRLTLSTTALGLRTGDEVEVSTTGTLPSPLATGTKYYWITIDGSTGQVATSKDNALAGTASDLTDAGTGTHTVTRSLNKTFTADAATDEVTLSEKIRGLVTGNGVEVTTDGTLPAGLSASTSYYYIKSSDTKGKLATTYANAMAGAGIDITDIGTGTHTLHRKSEARYTCNGTFDTDQTPRDILEGLLTSCGGRLTYRF